MFRRDLEVVIVRVTLFVLHRAAVLADVFGTELVCRTVEYCANYTPMRQSMAASAVADSLAQAAARLRKVKRNRERGAVQRNRTQTGMM